MAYNTQYPDEDWVLNGRTTPFAERPRHLSNSQLTSTTMRLSQNSRYNPDNYRHSSMGLDLSGIRSPSPGALRKSVSFSSIPRVRHYSEGDDSDDSIDEELQRLMDRDDLDTGRAKHVKRAQSPVRTDIAPMTPRQAEWFTQPLHLAENEYPSPLSIPRAKSPSNRPVGSIGAALADVHLKSNQNTTARLIEQRTQPHPSAFARMTTADRLALQFFPTTFGASHKLRQSILTDEVAIDKTLSPPPKGLPRPITPTTDLYAKPKSRKNIRRRKNSFNGSRINGVDKMFTMSDQAPAIRSASVAISTPYQHDLAQLRMQRLRLEEEHILEVKRRNELERTRGPAPKWYEMKGPAFHYEAHKNNELINNEQHWQNLMDYRSDLMKASGDFQRSFNSCL